MKRPGKGGEELLRGVTHEANGFTNIVSSDDDGIFDMSLNDAWRCVETFNPRPKVLLCTFCIGKFRTVCQTAYIRAGFETSFPELIKYLVSFCGILESTLRILLVFHHCN